jgi:hypothetical protein
VLVVHPPSCFKQQNKKKKTMKLENKNGNLKKNSSLVCFVENDNLLSSRGKSHFLLGEHFDFVSDDINASAGKKPK